MESLLKRREGVNVEEFRGLRLIAWSAGVD